MEKINDSLAQDLYPLIFRNLSIDDLFNCRLVNKQFKYFSDHTDGVYKLVIGQPYLSCHWRYNNKIIEDQDIISLECFRAIKLLSIFNLDRNLKYLKIDHKEFELKELSNLMNLEYLDFNGKFDNPDQQIINLNNLKILESNNLSVKLTTPKLEKIQFYDINKIQLDCNPESIKHLITIYYDNGLEIFKNLEIIELKGNNDRLYGNRQSINENLLIIFKNLKQLKIFEIHPNQRMENGLIKILNDKIKLRREIEIYLKGFKIENIDKFNELRANVYSGWEFNLTNYDQLDSSFIYYLYYHYLENCVNNIKNDLPSTFFDKFQNIHRVDVYSVKDVDGLNWFLNNLKYLIILRISYNLSLGQIFYNNLPNTIKYLYIDRTEDINYDFILKLSKLIHFDTSIDKDLFDLAFTSFFNLKYLKKIIFYLKKKYIHIEKRGKYYYLNGKKLGFNRLVKKCNLIRLKN